MFYYLSQYSSIYKILNLFRYITLRTFLGLLTALIIYLAFGPLWIAYLKNRKMKQAIRDDGPQTHLGKVGTPTMGGVLIGAAVLGSVFLWGNLTNAYVWICLIVFVGMGLIGFVDDYRKVIKNDPKGLSGQIKIICEVILCLGVGIYLYGYLGLDTRLHFPFFKTVSVDLSAGYLVMVFFVVVGAANAVNLTDGLDGLVSVPAMISFMTYGVFAYLVGNVLTAEYLQLPVIRGAGEVAVVCGAAFGACLGFLWFNTYPAEIFMGDVGALALGGLLGVVALITKQEILLVLIGGVFVIETLSVILQVASFKMRGKRIFKMAPLHHHFELKGWKEPKVIVRFWILSFIFALLSLTTLKLR